MNPSNAQFNLPTQTHSLAMIQIAYLIAAMLAAPASHAEIYKWRDAKGVMNYSDMPPPPQTQSIEKIKAQKLNPDIPLTRSDAYSASDAPPAKGRGDEKARRDEKAADQAPLQPQNEAADTLKAMEERLRAKNCLAARANYRNYAVGGRMQNVNEGGEREYLSDAQIQEGLSVAQQEIDENCPRE